MVFSRILGGEAGGYLLLGQEAGLKIGRVIMAEKGAYLIEGQIIGLMKATAEMMGYFMSHYQQAYRLGRRMMSRSKR